MSESLSFNPQTVAVGATSRRTQSLARFEGAAIHEGVPMRCWCFKKKDLHFLRKTVREGISRGRIKPTSEDPFEPSDDQIGPSIHTINDQLIKPVTACAGDCSWALMCHNEGGDCDLFITHCWLEGVFELIDKVTSSWPRGATYAYCCVLSNPQNLDIGHLIAHPRTSPFARALKSATWMLVIPNTKTSIYNRIWCVYEAYLAYSWGKTISVAHAPFRYLWLRLLLTFSVCIVLAVMCWSLQRSYCAGVVEDDFVCPGSSGKTTRQESDKVIKALLLRRVLPRVLTAMFLGRVAFDFLAPWLNCLGFVIVAWEFCYDLQHDWIDGRLRDFFIAFFLYFPLAETERVIGMQLKEENRQLSTGYRGSVLHAASSVAFDKELILGEIQQNDEESEVDHAIAVLLKSGMSTPTLREASRRGIDIRNSVYPGWSQFAMSCVVMLLWRKEVFTEAEWEQCFIFDMLLCICVYMYIMSPTDCKAFTSNAAWRIIVANAACVEILSRCIGKCLFLGQFQACVNVGQDPMWRLSASFTIVQILLCSALGINGVAQIPVFGNILANCLMSNRLHILLWFRCRAVLRGTTEANDPCHDVELMP